MEIDEPRVGPEEFKFEIAGHRYAYYLTTLLPYYGEAFCCRFRDAWTKAASLTRGTTAIKYFQSARTAFELIAFNGTAKPRSPEGYVLRSFRDKTGSQIEEEKWHAVTVNLSRAILTLGDNSFIESENPESRNKKLEALKAGLKWLHQGGVIPDVPLEGRLETRNHDSSKCMATLAFQNARFSIDGLNASDAYQAFLTMNVDMLEEVRRCLWEDIKDNYEKFKLGKALMSDPTVPDISDVEEALIAISRRRLRAGEGCTALGLTRHQGWVLALKILKRRASGGEPLPENILCFARSMTTHVDAQPYFEATTKTMCAAFHIVLIDVGGNSQPIEDIPFDCFKGKSKRGKIIIRSLRLGKNRAGIKASKKKVQGVIAGTIEEIKLAVHAQEHSDDGTVEEIEFAMPTKRLAGAMGKRINEMVDSLSETFSTEIDVTVTAPDGDSFDQALERLIDSISMSTHPEGHSICCMGSKIDPIRQQQAASQCLHHRQRITGQLASTSFSADLGYAVDTTCAVCPLRARLPEMMPYWHREARKASEALKVARGNQRALLGERAKIIREFA